jgi:hypothetical protein
VLFDQFQEFGFLAGGRTVGDVHFDWFFHD